MSRLTRVVAIIMLAASALALIGLITNPKHEPAATSPARDATRLAATGLAPIDDIVTFWSDRTAASPLDYLSRTQHGNALLVQAKETAGLETYRDAEAVFEAALERNPQHRPAQLGLARALHAQHRFDDALVIAQRVLQEVPTDWSARVLAADAHWALGDYDEAAPAYRQLLAEQRSAPLLSRAAQLASLSGDHNIAVALAEEALLVADTGALRANEAAFFRFQIGHFLAEAGELEPALGRLDEALQLDANHIGAIELSASLHAERGDLAMAAQRYVDVLELAPAADLHGSYADVLRAIGDTEGADVHEAIALDQAYEAIAHEPAERRHVAEFFLTRDPSVALELAELDLVERQDVDGYELLAAAHTALGDIEAAAEAEALAEALRISLR